MIETNKTNELTVNDVNSLNLNNNNNNNSNQKNLLNNAILFYENYNKKKLDLLNNSLLQPYSEASREDLDLIINMKSPMPALNWANSADLWKMMRLKDLQYRHDFDYLKRHVGIEAQMRAILIDWMVEISYAYRLHRETMHLSLEYMDRFMTFSKHQMRVDRLQLIGITSLFLAAKVEEIYPPKLKDFASHMENYSTNNEEAIQQFELFMLKTLNWKISPVTANTWLMTYLQIASINYYKIVSHEKCDSDNSDEKMPYNTHIVMPINIYKNSNFNLKDYLQQSSQQSAQKFTATQQIFYLNNYMRSISLLDLCIFDMESLKFNYSVLAAAALYHMCILPTLTTNVYNTAQYNVQQNRSFVQQCTGFKMFELDACIKWMYPYADVCKEILKDEKMIQIKQFSSVESEDWHNIQLYHQNLELLKEAQSRKTPCKFNLNPTNTLTPPDSLRKCNN